MIKGDSYSIQSIRFPLFVSSITLLVVVAVVPLFSDWMRLILHKVFRTFVSSSCKLFHTTNTAMSTSGVKYLGQSEAIAVDEELFNVYKFSVDQLMELAGLSVAVAVHRIYGESHKKSDVIAIAGPGNNGGDAMVAARHLKLFGFENVTLLNARKPAKDLFINLVHQAEETGVQIAYDPQPFLKGKKPSLILDGLFGFSFRPPVRPDFQPLMDLIISSPTIVSIDIPSGWDVEKGPPSDSTTFMPETLVSLTAPKKCAVHFKGKYHYLGGRFVPPKLAEKYQMNLPSYSGTDCVLKL